MTPLAILATAWSSLGANKLRASLTLLGIIIGVAAVISLMAVGRGAQESVTSRIASLGANLLFVRAQPTFDGTSSLTLADAYALEDEVFAPSVAAVAPELSAPFAELVWESNVSYAQALGVTASYARIRQAEVWSGQFISPAHVLNRSEVVVLGSQVAADLYGARDPVGTTVRLNDREFTIVGVLAEQGGGGFGAADLQVFVPITTAYYRLSGEGDAQGEITIGAINVQARSADLLDAAEREVATVLRLRHRITDYDDFTITNQQETFVTVEATTETFTIFLASIAGISLIVGGIGVMNIMLVSVTERTREIGIRKAVGAKRRDILFHFVTEATLLSLAGGGLGVLAGFAVGWALDGRNIGGQPFNTVFSGDIALLALVVSAAIGLFFGIYPAMRAASLHPIEALRYE